MLTTNIINATVTAYCACKLCCGPNAKGITANGQRPLQGITIAASRNIPFGSKVIMSTIGLPTRQQTDTPFGNSFIVQDRLAKRFDSRFDIYFAKHSDAKKFGIRTNQQVTIITTK